jgi:hypothetical protein
MPDDTGRDGTYSGDELDRKLAELTSEIAKDARLAEKSAAERAAAAAKAERKANRKAGRPGGGGGSGGSRRVRTVITAIAAVIVVTGGVVTWMHVAPSASTGSSNDTHLVRNGPVPSVSPAGPPADPFSGSPAAGYADGADGIVIPAAKPVGSFTAGQVRGAYREVKKLLIAAALNRRTLAGGAPDAFANLLLGQQRSFFVHRLDKIGLDKQGAPLSTRTWVASFAPGTTQFLTSTVKSHGTLTAKTATDSGRHVLRIAASQLFVYAIEPPHQPARWMRIVYHFEWRVDFAQFTDPGGALQPWVLAGQQVAGALCSMGDGYIHPDFPSGPAPKVKPTGAPVNPYSVATGGSAGYTCHSITGT